MAKELKVLNNLQPNDVEHSTDTSPQRPLRIWMGVSVVLFSGLATYLFFQSDPWGERPRQLPASFQLDLHRQWAIEPDLIRYRLQAQFALTQREVQAIASGPNDQIYLAGDQGIQMLDREGQPEGVIALMSAPTCLAVGGTDHVEPGRVYVGTPRGIEVFDSNGQPVATWPQPNAQALVTAIAVAHQDVFLADAGNRVVWRYDTAGERRGQIGQSAGFVINSPHFDVVVAAEDLLYVVNPGKLKIVASTFAGDLGAGWGRADSSIDGFFGCCNPTHLAILPDGRLVTSEQGIPRVKIYDSSNGTLDAVVAGPRQLGISQQSVGDPRLQQTDFDVATDSRGRVLVLDTHSKTIRVFVSNNNTDPSGAGS